jgi:hypothetical protein
MRTPILLATLAVLAAATAHADPPPAARMRPPCPLPSGAALVSVDRIKTGTQSSPEQHQTATIFENGSWSMTDTIGGKPENGCVPDAEFKHVHDELTAAPWQIQRAKIRCMMVSLVRTEYTVESKLVWTAKVCSGESLDPASATAIGDVDALVQKLDPSRAKLGT